MLILVPLLAVILAAITVYLIVVRGHHAGAEPRVVWISVRPTRMDRTTVGGRPLPAPLDKRLHEDEERTEVLDRPLALQPHYAEGEWS